MQTTAELERNRYAGSQPPSTLTTIQHECDFTSMTPKVSGLPGVTPRTSPAITGFPSAAGTTHFLGLIQANYHIVSLFRQLYLKERGRSRDSSWTPSVIGQRPLLDAPSRLRVTR